MSYTYDELMTKFRSEPIYHQFVRDMRAAAIEVRVYTPADGGERPAVVGLEAEDVAWFTDLELRRDALGPRLVVYPVV